MPDQANLSTHHKIAQSSDALQNVLAEVRENFARQLVGEDECVLLRVRDAEIVIIVMRTICLGDAMVAAWPTSENLCHLPVLWSEAEVSGCRGHAARLIKGHRREAAKIFELVIEPALQAAHLPHFKPPHLSLRDAYYWALGLVTSRSHERVDGGLEICPLLDLFNGAPEGPTANVDVHRGMWPFIRGAEFRNDCNIPCSAVSAKRDIAAGEPLLLSYGEVSSAAFLLKYGWVPEEEGGWSNPNESLSITLDPELLPPFPASGSSNQYHLHAASQPSSDAELRWWALHRLLNKNPGITALYGINIKDLGQPGSVLVEVSVDCLEKFARSGMTEDARVDFLRQILIMLTASQPLLHPLTGGWDQAEVRRALEATLRHTLAEGPRGTLRRLQSAPPSIQRDLTTRIARRDESLLCKVVDAISSPEVWRRNQVVRNRTVRSRQAVAVAAVAALLWWFVTPLVKLLWLWVTWPVVVILGRVDEAQT